MTHAQILEAYPFGSGRGEDDETDSTIMRFLIITQQRDVISQFQWGHTILFAWSRIPSWRACVNRGLIFKPVAWEGEEKKAIRNYFCSWLYPRNFFDRYQRGILTETFYWLLKIWILAFVWNVNFKTRMRFAVSECVSDWISFQNNRAIHVHAESGWVAKTRAHFVTPTR